GNFKSFIFSNMISFFIAFPLHSNSGEATWTDSKTNQAYDKTELTKDEDKIYKNHIDSKGLYSQEDEDNKNPVTEEVQHKLNMESDRLRSRLRQELAELRERLSPSPVHFSSTLESMRERLAPLTQQLQSSLSSNTQDMCGQLSLYLQGLETAEAQAETSPPLYHEAVSWMGQTLEHSSSKLAGILSDFHTKAIRVIEHQKETSAREEEVEVWQKIRSRLGQKVTSLRVEAQDRVGALKTELAALLETTDPVQAKVAGMQASMERLFQGLEENLKVQGASSLSSIQPGDSLHEDFSVKFSALIQDILQSVQ
uniref:Uncharacterized protein n=1 Tax=Monopterus albus TaxID=43700 RepID=A0A3Q3J0L2_MONAL